MFNKFLKMFLINYDNKYRNPNSPLYYLNSLSKKYLPF